MKTSVIGYPRVGAHRELKFASERYFNGTATRAELLSSAADLRRIHWLKQQEHQINWIPSNDFSFYDNILDTAVLFNIIPERYRALNLDPLDTYFAMARGYQGVQGDVKALAMKKWFHTNYHYLLPEIEDSCKITLTGTKPLDEFSEANALGILTKPVITGPYTFLKLARFTGTKNIEDVANDFADAYISLLHQFSKIGVHWVQFDEPALVRDMDKNDLQLFKTLYSKMLPEKGSLKLLLQTYFGDIRDCYQLVCGMSFNGIGLDFTESTENIALIQANGFPPDKILFAGVVNGKNIWKNNYTKTISLLEQLKAHADQITVSTSCSLLHVPYTLANETSLDETYKKHFAFAEEKLCELEELQAILSDDAPDEHPAYTANKTLFAQERVQKNACVWEKLEKLAASDFTRLPFFSERTKIQRETFQLPPLPTTTIGSFPQTQEVRADRLAMRTGKISNDEYNQRMKEKIAECIALQEKLGLDVLVHGEFERTDMVEFFGEKLDGYLIMKNAWVQSYGTRCVKPPVVWGDISRPNAMTTEQITYAQSLTKKPVKGMLTGPVTILNWSFPREDISLKDCAMQIALAIREEVLDLEANGIQIIQIDEAALREKLPLRKSNWHKDYLDWAIPAFRLVHSGANARTQIHTHMCYSEFNDIILEIDAMDADVISFEASRSDLSIIDALKECGFQTQVGPGVYDIHSPRVPTVEEMKAALRKMLEKLPAEKLWVNPDCGLKTRGIAETTASLANMVAAAKEIREEIQ